MSHKSRVSKWVTCTVVCSAFLAENAFAELSIGPYASVSSTKAIKPNAKKGASDETVTQRTTYGLNASLRLWKFFLISARGGVNKTDTTKKASAMRDEYGDVDFQSDLNVDPNSQTAEYRYIEEQRVGTLLAELRPLQTQYVWIKVGAGVRARQRLISSSDTVTNVEKKVTDPVRYNAVGTAGLGYRLFKAFRGSIDYTFYFLKFPQTEPHEQEVAVSFGVSI